jgi:hypothetical protein
MRYPRHNREELGRMFLGHPVYRSRKVKGTRAYWKSGEQREDAETVAPQGPRNMVKAKLLEVWFQSVYASASRYSI